MCSAAGVRPMRESTRHALYSYVGGSVGFYFCFTSAYTRALLLPAALGAALFAADLWYFDDAISAEHNATWQGVVARLGDDALDSNALNNGPSLIRALSFGNSHEMACGDEAARENATHAIALEMGEAHGHATMQRAGLTLMFLLTIVLWSACFGECWKRRQALLAQKWGALSGAAPPPTPNPKFKSQGVACGFYNRDGLWVPIHARRTDPISWKRLARVSEVQTDLYFSSGKRCARQLVSALVLLAMMAACVATMFFLQLFAAFMASRTFVWPIVDLSPYTSTIVGLCNASAIATFNYLWRVIALRLVAWENYRTQPRRVAVLTNKLFVFQCINSYCAFIAPPFALIWTAPFGFIDARPPSFALTCPHGHSLPLLYRFPQAIQRPAIQHQRRHLRAEPAAWQPLVRRRAARTAPFHSLSQYRRWSGHRSGHALRKGHQESRRRSAEAQRGRSQP